MLRLLRTGGFEAILTSYTPQDGQHLYMYDKISCGLVQSYVVKVHKVPLPPERCGRFSVSPIKRTYDIRGGTGKCIGGRMHLTGNLHRLLST